MKRQFIDENNVFYKERGRVYVDMIRVRELYSTAPITIILPKKKRIDSLSEAFGGLNEDFPDRSKIQKVVIRNGVERLGDELFKDCISLESIELPESIDYIGEWTFSGCSALREIIMPQEIKHIGDFAFNGCSELVDIYNQTD